MNENCGIQSNSINFVFKHFNFPDPDVRVDLFGAISKISATGADTMERQSLMATIVGNSLVLPIKVFINAFLSLFFQIETLHSDNRMVRLFQEHGKVCTSANGTQSRSM